MNSGTELSGGLKPGLALQHLVDKCGLACLCGYALLAWYSRGTVLAPELPVFFLLLAWVSLPTLFLFACCHRQPAALPAGRLIFWAALFRACGLFGVPLFEDDWFRYLWDGYRFAETGTPYGWAPAASFSDPSVPPEFQRILDQVNYPDLPTIYGPVSQYAFLLSYYLKAASLAPLQLIFIGFDLLLIRLLLSAAPAGYVLLYAWCPLVVKEIAFTAHPDGMGACLLIAAVLLRHRDYCRGAAICLALAAGAKLLALLAAPWVLARAGWRATVTFGVTLALLYLPFLLQGSSDAASLLVFARNWEFNSALYGALSSWLPAGDAKLLLGLALLALGWAYWRYYRRNSPGAIPRGDWIYGLFLFCAPVINPWYSLWLLPFATIYPSFWAWTAAWTLLLAYLTHLNLGQLELDLFAHPVWVRPLEFGLILLALGVDCWRGSRRRT